MDNQHKLIRGYRDLSLEEIDLMNEVKAMGERVGQLMEHMSSMSSVDARWVSIARTDLQKGFMCLTRAIAQPGSF